MTDAKENTCSRGTSPEPAPPQYVLDALASIGIVRNPEHEQLPTSEEPWMTRTEPNGEQGADTLADALETMQQAAENDGRSAERERFRTVLREHWLTEIQCHHESQTDTAHCYCTIWASGALPSVGDALNAWIGHVMEQVAQP